MTVQPTVLVVMTTLPLASVGVTVLEYSSSIRDAGNPNPQYMENKRNEKKRK